MSPALQSLSSLSSPSRSSFRYRSRPCDLLCSPDKDLFWPKCSDPRSELPLTSYSKAADSVWPQSISFVLLASGFSLGSVQRRILPDTLSMHHVLLVRSSYSLKARQAELQVLQSLFPVKRHMMYSMAVLCSIHPGLCMRAVLRMPTANPGLHLCGCGCTAPFCLVSLGIDSSVLSAAEELLGHGVHSWDSRRVSHKHQAIHVLLLGTSVPQALTTRSICCNRPPMDVVSMLWPQRRLVRHQLSLPRAIASSRMASVMLPVAHAAGSY